MLLRPVKQEGWRGYGNMKVALFVYIEAGRYLLVGFQ